MKIRPGCKFLQNFRRRSAPADFEINSTKLVPGPSYSFYKRQAEEFYDKRGRKYGSAQKQMAPSTQLRLTPPPRSGYALRGRRRGRGSSAYEQTGWPARDIASTHLDAASSQRSHGLRVSAMTAALSGASTQNRRGTRSLLVDISRTLEKAVAVDGQELESEHKGGPGRNV